MTAQQLELSGVPEKPLVPVDDGWMQIIRSLSEKGADVQAIKELIALRNEEIARLARLEFIRAKNRVSAAAVKIKHDKENTQTKSSYASLLAIAKALDPVIVREKLSLSFGTGTPEIQGWMRTTLRVSHNDGHSEDYYIDLPLDVEGPKGQPNKSKIHGAKSAGTYGRVILKLLAFDITTGGEVDDDGNAAGGKVPELIDEKQIIELREWIGAIGEGHEKFDAEKWEAKFCHSLGVDALEVMPAEMLGKAKNLLKKAEAAK